MITIIYNEPGKWPVTVDAKTCEPSLATPDVRCVTINGDDLEIVCIEFQGLPLPKYMRDWIDGRDMQWWWTDAVFILANIQSAYKVNKGKTK